MGFLWKPSLRCFVAQKGADAIAGLLATSFVEWAGVGRGTGRRARTVSARSGSHLPKLSSYWKFAALGDTANGSQFAGLVIISTPRTVKHALPSFRPDRQHHRPRRPCALFATQASACR